MRFKKLLCSLLAATLMTPALFASPISVNLQGHPISLNESPVLINQTVYLPLRSFTDALAIVPITTKPISK